MNYGFHTSTLLLVIILSGDESDSSLAATEEVWHRALFREKTYPGLALYVGGHSNHLNGAFAGISQIQVSKLCLPLQAVTAAYLYKLLIFSTYVCTHYIVYIIFLLRPIHY